MGLHDRPSLAHLRPHRACPRLETRHGWSGCASSTIGALPETARMWGCPSQVHRILVRYGVNRLVWMKRPTGRVVRRYQRAVPNKLVHMDVKNSDGFPGAAADGRLAMKAVRTGRRTGGAAATTSSTPWSMTTAISPTQRFSPTSRATRAPPCALVRTRSSPTMASTSKLS